LFVAWLTTVFKQSMKCARCRIN